MPVIRPVLISCSPSFSDIVTQVRARNESRIRLTDPDLETEDVFAHFLNLIIGTSNVVRMDDDTAIKVIRFARKYQVQQASLRQLPHLSPAYSLSS